MKAVDMVDKIKKKRLAEFSEEGNDAEVAIPSIG